MKIIKFFCNKIEILISVLREKYKRKKKSKLLYTDFTLVASNCNGGVILHDLNLRFNTPFINLQLSPQDFIKLANDFKYYMALDVKELADATVDYPVGLLGDIKIYFVHYKTFKEAKEKWDKRKQRINYGKVFFMLTERDQCSFDDLKKFDVLKTKNKVVFTHKKYYEIKSSFYIRGFEHMNEIRLSMHYPHFYSIKRYVDQFNFVKWINNNY